MLKCSVIGNIGADPEQRYSASGTPLLQFNVASNGRTRTPEGEWQDVTTWVRVRIAGNRAESLANHLRKGMRVYVDGRLEARPWTNQSGQPQAGLEIFADTIEFFSPRQQDDDYQPIRASVADERRQPKGQDDDADLDLPF